MEIYHVVLVEDEPYAARHIRSLIEKEGNLRVSAVYENGEDALNDLGSGELKADLLVTDIQMPGISGLNLIRRVQEIRPGIPSIIISGYSSFDYAKEAISLGTLQYLLKPVNVEELSGALQTACREAGKKRLEEREQFVRKVLKGSEEAFGSDNAFGQDAAYRVMVFSLSLSTEDMLLCCADQLQKSACKVLAYRYCLILLQKEEDEKKEPLEKTAQKIRINVCEEGIHGTFVVGEGFFAGEDVRQEIDRLYHILQNNFRPGKINIVPGHEETVKQHPRAEEHRQLTTLLLQQLNSSRIGDLKAVYDRIFDLFETEQASVREMRYALYTLVSRIYQIDSERFDPTIENNRIMLQMYRAGSYGEARDKVWEIIEKLAERTQAEKEHQDRGPDVYWKILHFLNSNISENYSLQEIADSFHISQPYLSKLFRRYKGVSYKEYCTDLKVQTSIRLMEENPNMLIKEIAERVGYDQLYFSSVFYRVMGEYPKQYRNRFGRKQ